MLRYHLLVPAIATLMLVGCSDSSDQSATSSDRAQPVAHDDSQPPPPPPPPAPSLAPSPAVEEPAPFKWTFAVYVEPQNAEIAEAIEQLLGSAPANASGVSLPSIEQAVASDADVLVLLMQRSRREYGKDLLERLKQKKVIGVGYGAAQLFGQLGLEIRGDACAQFSGPSRLKLANSKLLGDQGSKPPVSAHTELSPGDNFGMFVPQAGELISVVDVIARAARDTNYAPIVRQGNCVLIGLTAPPSAWSDEYRSVFCEISLALAKRKTEPFSLAQFELLRPGTYDIELAEGRSTRKASSKRFYFKFTTPTTFTASLEHRGSNSIMLLFMGEKDRLHLTREDARSGETLTISVAISEADLRAIGDQYWSLKVTNFDRRHPATCTLKVHYDLGKEPDD